VGLELVVAGFFLPPLVVGGGQFVSAGVVRVGDRGQQDDQFTAAVAVRSGTSYSITRATGPAGGLLVEGGLDLGQVLPCAGGGQDHLPPRPADRRVHDD